MTRGALIHIILGGGAAIASVLMAATATVSVTSCTERDSFAVDSVVVDRSWAAREAMENDELGGRSYYYALVDYPVNIDTVAYPELTDSVRCWISQMLLPSSSEPVMTRRVLEEAADVFFGELGGNEWGANKSVILRKVYEDGEYLSYDAAEYMYCGGSAHGMCHISGATFRKDDGHRLIWKDFGERDGELRKKLTDSMKKELGFATTDELMSSLLEPESEACRMPDGTLALPLPNAEPWLTSDGWVFSYQPYEIMCWAAGAPACRLHKKEITLDK